MIVLGTILCVVGAFVTLLYTAALVIDPAADVGAYIALLFLFGNVPLVAGALLLRAGRNKRRRQRLEAVERQLLELARGNNGRLTATYVAMATPLTIDEARELLDLFVTRGIVDTDVGDNGAVLYTFRELTAG